MHVRCSRTDSPEGNRLMLNRRFFAEGAAIALIAVLCATVSNLAAARERKVAWVGDYPRALQVTSRPADPPSAAVANVPDPATETAAVTSAPAPTVSELPATQPTQSSAASSVPPTSTVPAPATRPTTTTAAQVTPPAAAPAPTTPKKVFAPHPDVPFVEISSDDAMQLWHEKAIFIDARRTDVFAQGHIAGSRSMPVWEADINDRIADFYSEVPDQQNPIVVYCSGGNCEDSHMLAEKLWGIGYENVCVYKDGYPAWQKMGGAVQ